MAGELPSVEIDNSGDKTELTIRGNQGGRKSFKFDRVFGPEETQGLLSLSLQISPFPSFDFCYLYFQTPFHSTQIPLRSLPCPL